MVTLPEGQKTERECDHSLVQSFEQKAFQVLEPTSFVGYITMNENDYFKYRSFFVKGVLLF